MTAITPLTIFITQRTTKQFKWGWFDCNTYIVEYVDWLTGSNILREVRGKYWDAKSAFRFTREYKKLDAGLEQAGFVEVDELQDGDVITYEKNGFVCGHIYAFDRAHSVDTDVGYMCVPIDRVNLADPKLKIWRHNG